MWAVARYDLRLSEDEFWALSLREWTALVERRDSELERAEWGTATLTAMVVNMFRKENSKPFEPAHFLNGKGRKQYGEQEEMTGEYLEALFRSMPGITVERI